ncbi:MAG: hypothetical protein J6Y48_03625 [Clostridia bacterium]|nr:hypothetical protein [Clostridia bacterium]
MSRWTMYNPNPDGRGKDDCAVRAIAAALGTDWDGAFLMLTAKGYDMHDLPNANPVWGAVLRERGFRRRTLPDHCPDCYRAEDFAREHPVGIYVLGFGDHVATIRDGWVYDSWDSTQEIPQYYWTKEDEKKWPI